MIQMSITGINSLMDRLKRVTQKKLYDETVEEIADLTVTYAKMYAPERTGIMADAIEKRKVGDGWEVVCTTPWAVFNEYGTIHMPAGTPDSPLAVTSTSGKYAFRPFLRSAAIRAKEEIPSKFAMKWKEYWG